MIKASDLFSKEKREAAIKEDKSYYSMMGLEYSNSICKNDLGSECDWLDGAKIGDIGFNNSIVVQVEKNIKSDKILIPIDCIISGKSVKVDKAYIQPGFKVCNISFSDGNINKAFCDNAFTLSGGVTLGEKEKEATGDKFKPLVIQHERRGYSHILKIEKGIMPVEASLFSSKASQIHIKHKVQTIELQLFLSSYGINNKIISLTFNNRSMQISKRNGESWIIGYQALMDYIDDIEEIKDIITEYKEYAIKNFKKYGINIVIKEN